MYPKLLRSEKTEAVPAFRRSCAGCMSREQGADIFNAVEEKTALRNRAAGRHDQFMPQTD